MLPVGLASVRERTGAPWAGSITQSLLAVVVVIAFAIAGAGSDLGILFPVVTLFTWLTNTGALGLVLLMAVVSLAVIGYFRRDPRDVGGGSRLVAPILAFLALSTVLVLIVANFNVLLGQEESTATTFVLPGLIAVAGIAGVAWALVLRSRRPDVYRRIGHGAEDLAAEHLG